MENEDFDLKTPRDFYKNLRPEYFSDSETVYKVKLSKEVLAYEIENISVNQKQDQFESLARKLAEKFIAPNLIPQVGPTGGGDGKTDTETHPVSEEISNKWYVPDNGWKKDENWAFAISSKEDWRGKLRSDIKSILSTKRGYTKIFFISNRKISSKKKKDAQDKFKEEFNIDITILDGEWIIEKIINNDLIQVVVDSLGLSDVYKEKQILQGANDTERRKLIEDLELGILNPKRYFEIDYQLIEDCLQSAILSREIEDSREVIDGKFLRALRFAKKLNNKNQLCRIYYQQAWTSIFWFNDLEVFVENYLYVKELVNSDANINSIKLYSTLFTILKTHKEELHETVNFKNEKKTFHTLLEIASKDKNHLTLALTAKTLYNISLIYDYLDEEKDCETIFSKLDEIVCSAGGHLSYPFDSTYKSIMIFGKLFPESKEYDNLIESLAIINEKRNSELAASDTFIRRAINKFDAGLYKDAVVFLGKVIVKLSKEESEQLLILSLRLLSNSYRNLGLLWASHNCLLFASAMSLKTWFKEGYVNKKTYDISIDLAKNEILLGRIPSILSVCELINVLEKQVEINLDEERDNTLSFIDISLSNRILNSEYSSKEFKIAPNIFESVGLEISSDTLLYILGHTKKVIESVDNEEFGEEKLKEFMSNIISQPIKNQFLYETDFINENEITFKTIILGAEIEIIFTKQKDLFLISEALLAILEGFFSTSFDNVVPISEKIIIRLNENQKVETLNIVPQEQSNEFLLELNSTNFFKLKFRDELWKNILFFIATIMSKNFMIDDSKEFLKNIFEKEEVYHRVSLAFNHNSFALDFYGNDPKLFFEDWYKEKKHKTYDNIRKEPMNLDIKEFNIEEEESPRKEKDFKNIPHNKRKVHSIVDSHLWDEAKWRAFGFFIDRNHKLGLTILFENFESGKKIFDAWRKDIGEIDEKDKIRIAIIKGVNKGNPHWYRVHVSSNFTNPIKEGEVSVVSSRFHELNAIDSKNLDNLINYYTRDSSYTLYPAYIDSKGQFTPDLTRGIEKKELIIKNAWEISLNDMDCVIIRKGDEVVIPENIENPPVLEVLKRKINS
ncbi:hypothetical protein [Aequorivita vladivostokensis]|uniref:Tetratricopeptide repeat protein n=1 Tax=Aequorivita vladivostokensis TaxID=171194 RepID=A0ABR5DIZ4_9FLAO|nr:hypothetical protein [Aequorivita vladivostokensis]KJJ38742.1 hypothetical protein MB09_08680 [Aequorivita vladivostokensis]